MDILVTSFGRDFRLPRLQHEAGFSFYGMPPVIITDPAKPFTPDHIPFIFGDKLLMDEEFFHHLIYDFPARFEEVANFYKEAYYAERLKLIDIDEIPKKYPSLLNDILTKDLLEKEKWNDSLQESFRIWEDLCDPSMIKDQLHISYSSRVPSFIDIVRLFKKTSRRLFYDSSVEHPHIDTAKGEQFYSNRVRHKVYAAPPIHHSLQPPLYDISDSYGENILSSYLAYINLNLINSLVHGAHIYDWGDMTPFYQMKSGAKNIQIFDEANISRHAISILFPNFEFINSKDFFKRLDDERIFDLRKMLKEITINPSRYNEKWAQGILNDMFDAELKASRISNLISWTTLPITALPLPFSLLGNLIDKSGQKLSERAARKDLKWSYFLRSLVERSD